MCRERFYTNTNLSNGSFFGLKWSVNRFSGVTFHQLKNLCFDTCMAGGFYFLDEIIINVDAQPVERNC